jgi:hypothetical protein
MLYSPRDLPSLFHPGPTFRVLPSRLYSSNDAVHPSRCRFPHELPTLTPWGHRLVLQGFITPLKIRTTGPGSSRIAASIASLSFFPRLGFLPPAVGVPVSGSPNPLSYFPGLITNDLAVGTPEFFYGRRSPSLSRWTWPPWSFVPRSLSQ